jgi:hypothetical protein
MLTGENTTEYSVGDRVRVTNTLNLAPHGIVRRGATGTVVYTGDDGYCEILMDTKQAALTLWANHLWLIPPYTDDDIGASLERIDLDDHYRVRSNQLDRRSYAVNRV